MYPYLTFLALFFLLPLLPLSWFCRRELARHRRTVLWSIFFVYLLGGPWAKLAGSTGLEPAASGVTGRRYNQLNYDP